MTKLKQIAFSATLAGLFLSAGAFAQPDATPAPQPARIKVTVIHKTSDMPTILQIDPCALAACVEA